ncbi:hypothetical protein E4T47_06585 [Aureobasidium subglaciale]|nr:hypothetical protein E4T47_06585 [Aureobasidium subglaciale]
MPTNLDLGNLRLSSPSTGLDLALTSSASISTLAACSFLDTPSITNVESGRVWVAPATNVQLLLDFVWLSIPSSYDILQQRLVNTLRHAALWNQLNLQPSLAIEHSPHQDTSLRIVLSLTSNSQPSSNKKASIHRLGKDVPVSHLKPPDGLPHWSLDQVRLRFDIQTPSRSPPINKDAMLFECSTLPEAQAIYMSSPTDDTKHCVDLIDAALRLAITSLPPKALSGMKIIERSSFKHLDNICPAMWSPGHIEVDSMRNGALATRAVFLPTISHAVSHSVQQRARSISLREKLKEIARQESVTVINNQCPEPLIIQKAVSIRLWQLMQRRLRDPTAGKALKSIKISDSKLPAPAHGEDIDSILDFENDPEFLSVSQASACLEPDDLAVDLNLLEVEYGDEWEDLFTDAGVDEGRVDDDMLDCSYDEPVSHDHRSLVTSLEYDASPSMFEENILELDDWDDLDML